MTYKNDKFRNFYLLIILLLTNNTFPLIRCNLQAQIPFHICKMLFKWKIFNKYLHFKRKERLSMKLLEQISLFSLKKLINISRLLIDNYRLDVCHLVQKSTQFPFLFENYRLNAVKDLNMEFELERRNYFSLKFKKRKIISSLNNQNCKISLISIPWLTFQFSTFKNLFDCSHSSWTLRNYLHFKLDMKNRFLRR